MRVRTIAVPALAMALVAVACGRGDDPTIEGGGAVEGEATLTIAGLEANDHGSAGAQDGVEVELDDFYFEPTVLEGEAGQTVTLSLFNEGDNPHTFTIDEQGVDEELQPGQEDVTVDVTFPDSGALLFYCRFHLNQDMAGGLSVGGSLEAAGGDAPQPGSDDDY